MLFALICTDKPNHLEVRTRVRPAHIEYLQSLGDLVKAAGPFLDDKGDMTGTLVLADVPDRAAAEKVAANDPYALANLFQSIDIRGWRWALKNPEAK